MKLLFLIICFSFSIYSAQTNIERITNLYLDGDYSKALAELKSIKKKTKNKQKMGLINYWTGLCNLKLNEYDKAEKSFRLALKAKFDSDDIYYEYAQTLYVLDKLKLARKFFIMSVEKKYKPAVSLYYAGFISQQLKDFKTAVEYYTQIEKVEDKEAVSVIQPARMQIGEIYYIQAERQPNSFKNMPKYVIPQFEKALAYNPDSNIAKDIKVKIRKIQERYELLIFRMRNGRPTADPRYFVKGNLLFGGDDNVNAQSSDILSDLGAQDFNSTYQTLSAYGRYAYYPNGYFSIAPSINVARTRYNNSSDEVTQNNSNSYTGAVQLAYESLYNDSPSTTYLDFSYTVFNSANNANDKETPENFLDTLGLTFSQEMQFMKNFPTTLRLALNQSKGEEKTNSNDSWSIIAEQLYVTNNITFFGFFSYGDTVYEENEELNTTALTLRVDAIFPTFFKLFNPSIFLSLTHNDYYDSSDDNRTDLYSYGININRPLSKKWFLYLSYAISDQESNVDANIYDKRTWGVSLDYIY